MIIETSFRIEPGEYNTKRLIQHGRCDGSNATVEYIEGGVSMGKLVRLPNATGVVFKVLDGTNPEPQLITPPTVGKTYSCIKVGASVRPFAPLQSGGAFNGYTVLQYEIIWQQVGSVA